MTIPQLRQAIRLLVEQGFTRVEIRTDDNRKPYVIGTLGPDAEAEDDMAWRIDNC